MCNEEIIAAEDAIDEEDDHHIDICPNENAFERSKRGAEAFHYGHEDWDGDQQSVGDKRLHDAVMRDIVHSAICRGEEGL